MLIQLIIKVKIIVPDLILKAGKCIFPFLYQGKLHNSCVKGSRGLWCPTKVDSQQKPVKLGFCKSKKSSSPPTKKVNSGKKRLTIKKKASVKTVTKPKTDIDIRKHIPQLVKNIYRIMGVT